MKYKLIFLFAISIFIQLFLISCRGEEVGGSTYFLDNQSAYDLTSKSWGIEVIVNSGEKLEIGGAASFGGNPGLVGQLVLYRDSLGTEIVAYEQIPVVESLWLVDVIDDSQYGSIYYTLIVIDAMIK